MEYLLRCRDLFYPLKAKRVNHVLTKEEEWKKLNQKMISQIIDHGVFHHIAQETDAYAIWKKLEDTCTKPRMLRIKSFLMRRMVNLKLQSKISVAEHTSEFQNLVNQLSVVELQLEDKEQALLLFSSLPDNWEMLVVSIGNLALSGKLIASMVMDALYNEEAMGKVLSIEQSHALIMENGRRKQECSRDRRIGKNKCTYYHCDL